MRPTICSHGRKSWNCRLCKTEAAQTLTPDEFYVEKAKVSVQADHCDISVKKEPSGVTIMPGPCPVPKSMIPGKYNRMAMFKWGEYQAGGLDQYRMYFNDDNNRTHIWHVPKASADLRRGILTVDDKVANKAFKKLSISLRNIKECPVPRALYCNEVHKGGYVLDSWKIVPLMAHGSKPDHYRLNFSQPGTDMRYTQIIPIHEVVEYQRLHRSNPYKDERDSKKLLQLMSTALNKEVTVEEGTYIINKYLYRVYGRQCKLNGIVRLTYHKNEVCFPTTLGLKYTTAPTLYNWLRHEGPCKPMYHHTYGRSGPGKGYLPDGNYSEIERRILEHLSRPLPKVNDSLDTVNLIPVTIIKKGMTISIEDNCTIMLHGRKLHVRKEGDKMMLLDEGFNKLC